MLAPTSAATCMALLDSVCIACTGHPLKACSLADSYLQMGLLQCAVKEASQAATS